MVMHGSTVQNYTLASPHNEDDNYYWFREGVLCLSITRFDSIKSTENYIEDEATHAELDFFDL